jgi:hypothetical protein
VERSGRGRGIRIRGRQLAPATCADGASPLPPSSSLFVLPSLRAPTTCVLRAACCVLRAASFQRLPRGLAPMGSERRPESVERRVTPGRRNPRLPKVVPMPTQIRRAAVPMLTQIRGAGPRNAIGRTSGTDGPWSSPIGTYVPTDGPSSSPLRFDKLQSKQLPSCSRNSCQAAVETAAKLQSKQLPSCSRNSCQAAVETAARRGG